MIKWEHVRLFFLLLSALPLLSAADTLPEIRVKAEQGDTLAQFTLGSKYAKGDGVAKDLVEAAKWYRKAAEQGNAEAQYLLAWKYEYGAGVTRNSDEAMKWYRLAAEQGIAWAQCNLGRIYENGKVTAKNPVEAHVWLSMAIANGNILARIYLARLEQVMTNEQKADAKRLAEERLSKFKTAPDRKKTPTQ